jgi:tetratricopeptide (TPR) repeat protein
MILKITYGLIFHMICLFVFGAADVSGNNLDSLNNIVAMQLNNIIDTAEVFKEAHRSLFLSNKENNESGQIKAYLNLARFHENYGQLDSAIYYFKELKNIYKKSGNNVAVAESCLELKGLYNAKAAYAESMKEVYEALELYEEEDIQEGIALCFTHICDLLYYENKYEESAAYCDKAIAIQERLEIKMDLAVSYRYKASSLLFVDGELEQALETINNAIDIYNQLDETGIPILACLNGRGNILKYMERYDDAIADYQYIYEKCVKIGLDRYTIPSIGNIGHVYILQNKYEEALPYMLEAIDLIKASGETKNLWESYMHVSNI